MKRNETKFAHVFLHRMCNTCLDSQTWIKQNGYRLVDHLFSHAHTHTHSRLQHLTQAYLYFSAPLVKLSETLKIGQLNGIFTSETMCHQRECRSCTMCIHRFNNDNDLWYFFSSFFIHIFFFVVILFLLWFRLRGEIEGWQRRVSFGWISSISIWYYFFMKENNGNCALTTIYIWNNYFRCARLDFNCTNHLNQIKRISQKVSRHGKKRHRIISKCGSNSSSFFLCVFYC